MSDPRDNSTTPSINTGERRDLVEEERTARLLVRILGRDIGTAGDWDQVGDDCSCYYDFQPSPGVDLAEGHLVVNYSEGLFKYYNDKGDIVDTRDIISIVERLPRS